MKLVMRRWEDGDWKPAMDGQFADDRRHLQQDRDHLVVVTLNVWFDSRAKRERFAAVVNTLRGLPRTADFVCLQEVTPEFWMWLSEHPWIRQTYLLSHEANVLRAGYGVLILSRVPVGSVDSLLFPSRMGRQLLAVHTQINGHPISVGTVHLESLNSPDLRQQQLLSALAWLSPAVDEDEEQPPPPNRTAWLDRILGPPSRSQNARVRPPPPPLSQTESARKHRQALRTSLLMGDFNFDADRMFGSNKPSLEQPEMLRSIRIQEAWTAEHVSICNRVGDPPGFCCVCERAPPPPPPLPPPKLPTADSVPVVAAAAEAELAEEAKEALEPPPLVSKPAFIAASPNAEARVQEGAFGTGGAGCCCQWMDVWPALRPQDKGYTYDTANNRMLSPDPQRTRRREQRMRLDRVLVRSPHTAGQALRLGPHPAPPDADRGCLDKHFWKPVMIELIGDRPFADSLHLSDHFGIVTTLRWHA